MVSRIYIGQHPNGISIGSAVFAQYISVSNTKTDRHTDHAKCDFYSNRPHRTHCVYAVRSENKKVF